ncbi:Protein BZZ1 [Coemansia sp. RSA 2050]|nr:Protein BZZ1 [Coemansia sp. RSA 2050]KAJ2731062.1 Protein BZZ1 [Coemansia sp. BCRC 34962]
MATPAIEPVWQTDGVFKAASEARKQGRMLLVCLLDEGLVHGAAHRKQLQDALDNSEVTLLLAAHCVCVRVAAGTEEENSFTRLFPAAAALCVCLIHSAGNAVICGPNVTQARLAAEIQAQLLSSTQSRGSVHMGSLEAIENERLRRLLVFRRRGDMQRVKQTVRNFKDDRQGYAYIHGPNKQVAPTRKEEGAAGKRAGAHLLLRVSDGRTLMAEFDAAAQFSEVRSYIVKELGPAGIATMLPPRRVLADDDDSRTLASLGLVPTATLAIQVANVVRTQKAAEPQFKWFEWPALPHLHLRHLLYLGMVVVLPNEFGAINGYTEKQLEVYGALAKLLAEKAAAEKEYGRKVVELAQGFQQQLAGLHESSGGSGMDSLALTDTEAEGSGPLELTSAVNEWAARLEEEGRLHVQLGSKTSSDVAEELRAAYDGLAEARRKTLEGYQRLLAERDSTYEQKDRARAAYDARSKTLTGSLQRQERATTEKDQEKFRQRADRDASLRNQAKNAYILHVAVANAAKNAVNRVLTPRAMDAMQAINDHRVAQTRQLLMQMLAMQAVVDSRRAAATQRATSVISRVAPTADSDQLIKRRTAAGMSRWDEPADFRVVVDAAAGDDDAIARDGESQAILRNLGLQAQRDAQRSEEEMRAAASTAEQCRQRAQAGAKGSDRELERAADADRDAAIAELQGIQHHALHAAVELHLGHAVAHGSLHAFKPVTLALSRTCDYCAESIGGLNRKAARCGLCEYTCHAKCQIKVEPNCPGPDMDQKSGFLSMFGSLRGKKKPAQQQQHQQHQRSASVLSADSAASGASPSIGAASQASLPRQHPLVTPPALPKPQLTSPPLSTSLAVAGTVAVLYDFAGDGAITLTVRASDRVRVVEPDTDTSGWTAVELPNGLQGMVPTSYVDMSEYKPPPPAPIQKRMLAIAEPKEEYVVALYNFSTSDPDELPFAVGDRIQVISRDIGEGWLQGALLDGRKGRLPVAYVQNEDDSDN